MIVLKQSVSDQLYKIVLRTPLYAENANIYIKIDDYDGNNLIDDTLSLSDDSWTTTATAGKGTNNPKIIDVADVTDLVSGLYFISNGSTWEKINIVSVDSSTKKATIDASLKQQYPIGATITPGACVYTVPDSVVASEIQFICNYGYFNYTGQYVGQNEEGYVSANPVLCPVTIEDIYKIWPQLANTQTASNFSQENEDKLSTVWDNVRARLASSGIKPEQFRAVSGLKQVIVLEFAYLLGLSGVDPTGAANAGEFRDMIRRDLKQKWDDLWTSQEYIEQNSDSKKTTSDRMPGRKIQW